MMNFAALARGLLAVSVAMARRSKRRKRMWKI